MLLGRRHYDPRTMTYVARYQAEALTDRDIMRCRRRHIANEVDAALLSPGTDKLAGQKRRERRQRAGVPITVLAATLNVPTSSSAVSRPAPAPTPTSTTARHSPSTNSELLDSTRGIHYMGPNS